MKKDLCDALQFSSLQTHVYTRFECQTFRLSNLLIYQWPEFMLFRRFKTLIVFQLNSDRIAAGPLVKILLQNLIHNDYYLLCKSLVFFCCFAAQS
ncbi:hypothetical protein PGT21_022449 [Puccinia graminis f. sp. tritici]|uniref:Uncharacterized protein n=1 Tax=Puccinia graminis f. sp. tritici TaxID=56615 RepID=A0A5B0Q670_PUCGR|nr:hypothetical protein PGT21_022449 [Puccinia graminis f. sp. tritici]